MIWFVIDSVYVLYYIYLLVNVPFLHPWNEAYLTMVYDIFNVLLDSISKYFIEDLSPCWSRILAYIFLFYDVSLPGFGFRVMLAS
jgi:hypothetical protein